MTPVVQQAGEPTALSCPFCGSNNISDGEILGGALDETEADYTQSECRECGAVGPRGHLDPGEIDYGSAKAIAAWNRRASRPQQPQAETPLTAELLRDLKMQYGMVGTRDVDVAAWNAKLDRAIAALASALRAALSNTGAHPPGAEPVAYRALKTGALMDAAFVKQTWPEPHDRVKACLAPLVYASPPEARADAGTAWQPIETAPKDGSYVLMSAVGSGVWIGHHQPVAVSGYRFDDPWRSCMLNHRHIPEPGRYVKATHWMPLPLPPEAQEPKT